MPIKKMQDLELTGKTVVIREDLNVPMKDGQVTNDKRIRASLPTIRTALEKGAGVVLLVQGGFDGVDFVFAELAHELADELHLAALAFKGGDALRFGQGVEQLVGQLQALAQVRAQRQQLFAHGLQGVAFALEVGFAGLGRAFEFGLVLQVEFAAFGDEAAFDVIAFLGFA